MKAFYASFVTTKNTVRRVLTLATDADDAWRRIQEVCPDYSVLQWVDEMDQDDVFEINRIN